jgi:hypothetical protein
VVLRAIAQVDLAKAARWRRCHTMLTGLARLICGLHGHFELLHFAPGRLTLRCARCGHETPGWQIDSRTNHSQRVYERRGDAVATASGQLSELR